MSKIWTKFTGLVVFGLLLAAYPATDAAAVQHWQDAVPLRHVLNVNRTWANPLKADEVLSSNATLLEALKAYGAIDQNGARCTGAAVRPLIACIRTAHARNQGVVPGLAGIGGVNALAFLDAAEMTLNRRGQYDSGRNVTISLTGQIENYLFLKDPDPNVKTGTGLLWANTTITRTLTVNNNIVTTKSIAYRWEVRVVNDGFEVVDRDTSNPNDPFPNTMTFEQETLLRINDPQTPLNHKLWARGMNIIIEKVQKKNSQGTWVTIPNSGVNAKFYERTNENCIDMMFQNEPPQTLGDLAPPLYCLGRCGDPNVVGSLVLVNTGW